MKNGHVWWVEIDGPTGERRELRQAFSARRPAELYAAMKVAQLNWIAGEEDAYTSSITAIPLDRPLV